MADFVGDEKRLFERRAGVLMQDQPVAGDEYRAPAIKQAAPGAVGSTSSPRRCASATANAYGRQGSEPRATASA